MASVSAEAARGGEGRKAKRVIVTGVVALGLSLLGAFAGIAADRAFGGKDQEGSQTEVRSTPGVLVAVRELARLEGIEYRVERVVALTDKQKTLFGLVEAEDALLLVASGTIVAGVDLSGIGGGDFEVNEQTKSVRLVLPDSTVFSSRLDNERTFVYQRNTDLLAARKESLETEARREAERVLLDAAKEQGIVRRSNDSVKRTVESLVRSLGYRDVVVTFRGHTAPAGRAE
jgi:hypothetical protein